MFDELQAYSHAFLNRPFVERQCAKWSQPVPEIIDKVFPKTSPKRSFSMTEYERFGLVFTKTRVYKFGHRCPRIKKLLETASVL
jgi:hypothetical protein